MNDDFRFVPDQPKIDSIRFDWDNMVGRDLQQRLRTLTFRAALSTGVRTGKLKRDIKTFDRKVIADGLEGRVGSMGVRYAGAHHEGAKPHIILPKKKGGVLKFTIAGTVVFARKVNHPGNRPNPYLTRWLREAVR